MSVIREVFKNSTLPAKLLALLTLFFSFSLSAFAFQTGLDVPPPVIEVSQASSAGLSASFRFLSPANPEASLPQLTDMSAGPFRGEGVVYIGDGLVLPSISRVVILPATGGFSLAVNRQTRARSVPFTPPTALSDRLDLGENSPEFETRPLPTEGIWPPSVVTASEPAIMGGVRFATIRWFPYQYDAGRGELISTGEINVSISFGGTDHSSSIVPRKRRTPPDLRRILRGVALNPDELARDDDDDLPGSILYVAPNNQAVLNALNPLIEWRKRTGADVSVLATNRGGDPAGVKEEIQAYYDDAEIPPETVVLVGDASGDVPIISAFDTRQQVNWVYESDHPYALLEGDDLLPEVAIGRISVASVQELANVVAKIIGYESDPAMPEGNAANWQERAAFTAIDWTSGQSSVDACLWAGRLVEDFGYRDTRYLLCTPDNQTPAPNGFMTQAFEAGVSIVALRGSATLNGWSCSGGVMGLRNSRMLPFVILATCNTGDFMQGLFEQIAWTEGMLRNLQGGGIGAIGAAGATSCQYNNVMLSSTLRSIYSLGVETQGWALMGAKFDLYNNYAGKGDIHHPDERNIENWIVTTNIYNLMGDPATKLFTKVPTVIAVEHPEELTEGTTSLNVTVTEAVGGEPVSGATVCLYVPEFCQAVAITDAEGNATLVFDALIDDQVAKLTVTKRNTIPYLADLDVDGILRGATISAYSIDDEEDELASAGERFNLDLRLLNLSARIADEITVSIFSDDERITIHNGQNGVQGGLNVNQAVNLAFEVELSNAFHHGETALLRAVIAAGEDEWESFISIPVISHNLVFGEMEWEEEEPPGPGDEGSFTFTLKNLGPLSSPVIDAQIFCEFPLIGVIDDLSEFDEIAPGEEDNVFGQLTIGVSNLCPGGRVQEMGLRLEDGRGFVDTLYFKVALDTAEADQAFGQEGYGYLCIDNTDVEWFNAPEFDWIEIVPGNNGENGTRLDLDDPIEEADASIVVDLPFDFVYYGQPFDQITVCTNGWIAMGDQHNVTTGRNTWIPSGMVSAGMICPFWDDLITNGDRTGVWVWFDEENHLFVIQWNLMERLSPDNAGAIETFQVILYDAEFWPGITGDGDIKFQYLEVADEAECYQTWDTPFATVGIGSPDRTEGLVYTYFSFLNPGAAPLEPERAILFTTFAGLGQGVVAGRVTDLVDDAPIANATVMNNFGYRVQTDDNGRYVMSTQLLNRELSFTAFADGYNDTTMGPFVIDDQEDTLELDFSLRHPEFLLSIERFEAFIDSGDTAVIPFFIINNGNGPLNWRGTLALVGDEDAEPWEIRHSINVAQITGDDRINGVVFGNDRYYVAGTKESGIVEDNSIYVFDREGALVDSFLQVGSDRMGYKDMDWDGEKIWAAGEDSIYAISTTGEVLASFPDPNNPSNRIACDPNGFIYFSGTTTDIRQMDTQGNLMATYNRQGMRIYGLAWYPRDPDGYKLYILHDPGDDLPQIAKMNIETGEIRFVAYVPVGLEDPVSFQITSEYSPSSWVGMFTNNRNSGDGGDQISVVQVEGRSDWMQLSVLEGTIPARSEDQLRLVLDSRTFEYDVYEGEFRITHNAAGHDLIVPIKLTVTDEPPNISQQGDELPLEFSLKSIYPNPFNDAVKIVYSIPSAGYTSLKVFDMQGRVVSDLLSGNASAGVHSYSWQAKGMTAGIYFVRFEAGGKISTEKVLLLK